MERTRIPTVEREHPRHVRNAAVTIHVIPTRPNNAAVVRNAGIPLVLSWSRSIGKPMFTFELYLQPAAHGIDEVEFLVSANVGEEPRPLDKVASGGELSRIALALKTCTRTKARQGVPRTLVFDEVDAGVGGAAAETVGRRLKQLAASEQVLCVTHLAQIAGFADHHYVVSKRESAGRTTAEVREMKGESRVREIGRMLSGQHLSAEALRHAQKLMEEYAGHA